MTEKDIAESLTQGRAIDGIETAERLVFEAYDEAYSDWGSTSENGDISQVTELEKALVSLRAVRELLETGEVDDEVLQRLALQVPCEDADIESISNTVEQIKPMLAEME